MRLSRQTGTAGKVNIKDLTRTCDITHYGRMAGKAIVLLTESLWAMNRGVM